MNDSAKTMDIESLDLGELKELQIKVGKAITSYEDRRRKEALDAVKKAAQEHGYSVQELVGAGSSVRKTVEPKYANPSDPAQTWTGRGRKPRWVVEQLDAGKSLDDFTIG